MKVSKVEEWRACPHCGSMSQQINIGKTSAGSQRCRCKLCKRDYTPQKKDRKYSVEVRTKALKLLMEGVTGRGVGRQLKMSKSNAIRWTKELAEKEREKKGSIDVDKSANKI